VQKPASRISFSAIFDTWLLAYKPAHAKVIESVIAMIVGHKRTSITSRYITPQWDEMGEAVAARAKICHQLGKRG